MFEKHRVALFTLTLGFGVVPVGHWAYIHAHDPDELNLMLPRVIVAYGLMLLGTAFYITRWPECCRPGRFDILFASHQLWHACVLAAFMYWYYGSIVMLDYRLQHPCRNVG